MTTAKAIVSRGRHDEGKWQIEEVKLRSLKDDELLVRMVASGICHTDIVFGDRPDDIGGWPRVLGHEGSGYVEQVGQKVTVAKPGDPILLSFASCLQCKMCTDGHFSHCVKSVELNFLGDKAFADLHSDEPNILGTFFGQSSFASLTIARESSVVNVKDLVETAEDLKLFAPLGCGIQTGSGTILNVAQAKPTDSVAIMGSGGVGLAAVMAAKLAGCHTVIVIDRVQQRLNLAKELGATHVIDTSAIDLDGLVTDVRKLTDGYGTSITMDTTGVLPLIQKGIEFTARRGQYIQVGSTKPDVVLQVPLQAFMDSGKKIIGAIEGQVVPQEYIPQMIEWHRQGKFPFHKFMKQYAADKFMDAIHGMHSGGVIKPIIVWQQ